MNEPTTNNELGEYLQRVRLRQGLSLRRVAGAAGLNATYLMRLERGEYASPDPRHLQSLARVLEVEATDLYLAAGYNDGGSLPGLAPYLRAKYDLPASAVAQLEAHFELLADKYRHQDVEPDSGGRR